MRSTMQTEHGLSSVNDIKLSRSSKLAYSKLNNAQDPPETDSSDADVKSTDGSKFGEGKSTESSESDSPIGHVKFDRARTINMSTSNVSTIDQPDWKQVFGMLRLQMEDMQKMHIKQMEQMK